MGTSPSLVILISLLVPGANSFISLVTKQKCPIPLSKE